jgi:hypothetical protein
VRDYVFRNAATGQFVPVAKIPTKFLRQLLAQGERTNFVPRNNPNTTRENILDRLRLELFIRELNL